MYVILIGKEGGVGLDWTFMTTYYLLSGGREEGRGEDRSAGRQVGKMYNT